MIIRIKKYLKGICPECKNATQYPSNPAYIHICESCGYKTTQGKLLKAIDSDLFEKDLQEFKSQLEYLLKKYPSVKSFSKK